MMTCVVIDDEPLAAEMLTSYVRKTNFLELMGTYNSAVDAMRVIRNTPPNLIFLDIQMPELSGLEFATILAPQTMVIFTTAFERYAVDSYKVNTVDYLLKPISYETFLHSASKALKRYEAEHRVLPESKQGDRFIYVKSDYKLVRIFFDDILYIEGLKDYVQLHLSTPQKKVLCLMNMKTLEDNLPHPEFMRVHRSYIVHMPKADSIDRLRIVFGDNYIPISESYKDAVQKYINNHMLN